MRIGVVAAWLTTVSVSGAVALLYWSLGHQPTIRAIPDSAPIKRFEVIHLEKCSGVLIGENLALTASHCKAAGAFSVSTAGKLVSGGDFKRLSSNDVMDLAILRLAWFSGVARPGCIRPGVVTPVENQPLRAYGTGMPNSGQLLGTTGRVESIDCHENGEFWGCPKGSAAVVVVLSEGRLCTEDSGGGVFSDSETRLLGVLSGPTSGESLNEQWLEHDAATGCGNAKLVSPLSAVAEQWIKGQVSEEELCQGE